MRKHIFLSLLVLSSFFTFKIHSSAVRAFSKKIYSEARKNNLRANEPFMLLVQYFFENRHRKDPNTLNTTRYQINNAGKVWGFPSKVMPYQEMLALIKDKTQY